MPVAQIDFSNKQATGQETLGGAPAEAVNVMVDSTGTVFRRPGIASIPGVYSGVVDSTGISGIYSTIGGKLFAIGSTPQFRQIYALTAFASPTGSATSDATLAGTLRPTFAETQLLLAIAGGDKMQKIVLSTGASSRLGGQPPFASHVVANSSRLLGNLASVTANTTFDLSVVRFSDIANGNADYSGMESWTEGLGTAGHFSAEADPDPVVAIAENTNEVFCFGSTSLQVFSPDPTATYAPSVTRELGCSAPYSVIKQNQQFAWLDNLRRFVISDGRSESIISDPIKRTLNNLSTVSDCYGFRFVEGPVDALVWIFPTDGRTFAFQQGSGWAEWLGWNESSSNWTRFPVTAAHLAPSSSNVLVGTSDGRVGQLTLNANTDLGGRIEACVTTGFLAHGTDKRKKSNVVYVALRRGQSFGSVGPQAWLSWRDQPGSFGPPIALDLGGQGDTEITIPVRSLGIYRRRQWKFEFSSTATSLGLVSVNEDFDVLDT